MKSCLGHLSVLEMNHLIEIGEALVEKPVLAFSFCQSDSMDLQDHFLSG
ncbi:hypothetical protein IGI46_003667 [Enterococcus sp. AZ163]